MSNANLNNKRHLVVQVELSSGFHLQSFGKLTSIVCVVGQVCTFLTPPLLLKESLNRAACRSEHAGIFRPGMACTRGPGAMVGHGFTGPSPHEPRFHDDSRFRIVNVNVWKSPSLHNITQCTEVNMGSKAQSLAPSATVGNEYQHQRQRRFKSPQDCLPSCLAQLWTILDPWRQIRKHAKTYT